MDDLEKSDWYQIGRNAFRVVASVSMIGMIYGVGALNAGNDFPAILGSVAVMFSLRGAYGCERRSTILRTGEDPWEGGSQLGDRTEMYRNLNKRIKDLL